MPDDNKDWKEDLDDDLKSSGELKDLGSVKDLAKSYVMLSKAHSSRVDGISGEEDWDEFANKTGKFFKIPDNKDDYKLGDDVKENNEALKELGYKYKLHPRQVKGISEDYRKVLIKNDENVRKEQKKEFEKSLGEAFKDVKDKDEMISKALNNEGVSLDEFKKGQGHRFYDPKLQKLLYGYGKALKGSNTKTKEGDEPPVTTGSQKEVRVSMEKKFQWLYDQNNDPKSPLHDRKSPDFDKYNEKFEKWSKEVGEWADKEGIELGSIEA